MVPSNDEGEHGGDLLSRVISIWWPSARSSPYFEYNAIEVDLLPELA